MDKNYTISKQYYKKCEDECIKISNKYKHNKRNISEKKQFLRHFDSIHAHKNMRKYGNDWKCYNLNTYID